MKNFPIREKLTRINVGSVRKQDIHTYLQIYTKNIYLNKNVLYSRLGIGLPSGTSPVIRQAKPLIIIPAQRVGRLPTLSVT